MMSFRNDRLKLTTLGGGTLWLLTDIAEAKGKQAAYLGRAPEELERLRDQAIIQSTESSNRIEGVTVAPERLEPLVAGTTTPRDRSEQEIQGYRRALDLVHTQGKHLAVTPEVTLRLHALAQEGGGDAGQWKARDNEIIEFPAGGGAPFVRFKPVSAAETPAAMDELCRLYAYAVDQQQVHPLLANAALSLDFLCIHPLRDGNGRVARLLMLLALYHFDYDVGRYVSVERLIEEARDEYYESLRRSSQGWHEGQHDLMPWLNYFLVILRRAYLELIQRATER
jgi:Fic family protein